jgi:phosphatidylglycerophosphate synthase
MKLQAKNIPNALTICRMVLTLAIVLFLLLPFGSVLYTVNIDDLNLLSSFKLSFLLAGILFVIAVLTD